MVWRPRPNNGVYGAGFPNPAGGTRATTLIQPRAYDATKKYPLVLFLHHYAASGGADTVGRFDCSAGHQYDNGRFYFAPDGLFDNGVSPNRCWVSYNAPTPGDDFDYVVNGLILPAIADGWPIDTKRIYIQAYSNGAFFAHQLCLQYPGLFTAMISVAGCPWTATPSTQLAHSVPTVHCHGDVDGTVPYAGGDGSTLSGSFVGKSFIGAVATAALHASWNGVGGTLQAAYDTIDLVNSVAGNETSRQAYSGTASQTAIELWTRVGDGHTFAVNSGKGKLIDQWMQDNHRST